MNCNELSNDLNNRKAYFVDLRKFKYDSKEIKSLPRVNGYCIFIDISGSTKLKDCEPFEWILKIVKTFFDATLCLGPNRYPVKFIGDEIMYFVKDSDLHGHLILDLFSQLNRLVFEYTGNRPDIRCSITYCENIIELTFIENAYDVYGKDIDLAARLFIAGKNYNKCIIMNNSFYEKLRQQQKLNDRSEYEFIDNIEPENPPLDLKGFDKSIKYAILLSSATKLTPVKSVCYGEEI